MSNFTAHTTSDYDLPTLETRDVTRFCAYCNAETKHRVGRHTQDIELSKAHVHMVTEYAHCECGNTFTETIEKRIVMKEAKS
jgi:hypothetical protein